MHFMLRHVARIQRRHAGGIMVSFSKQMFSNLTCTTACLLIFNNVSHSVCGDCSKNKKWASVA